MILGATLVCIGFLAGFAFAKWTDRLYWRGSGQIEDVIKGLVADHIKAGAEDRV